MKFETTSSGYDLRFNAPDSVEAYDKLGGPGRCLSDAVAETLNRSTILAWQNDFAKVLEERTGIQRQVDADATAKAKSRAKNPDSVVREVFERFSIYNRKVNDQYANGDETKRAELEKWAQEVADHIPVDPTRQRTGAIASGDRAKAEDVLSGTPESIEAKICKYLDVVGDYDLARDDSGLPEKTSLARLIGRYVEALL